MAHQQQVRNRLKGMKKDIASIFNKFAGREVPMIESTVTLPRRRVFPEVKLANPNDPTIKAMEKVAEKNGLMLEFYWAGGSGLSSFAFPPEKYVIAHIEKESDGKWRVSKKLSLSKDLQP
jgi:hypothetical protein